MSRQDSPDEYVVLACSTCRDYFLAGKSHQKTLTCPHCKTTKDADGFRRVAEHPEREGAAELRARQLARDAGHGPDYAGVDDYGILGDQLRERDWSVVNPSEESLHSPEFYATATENACDRHREAFDHVQDHPIGTDWFAEAVADAGVDHPGADRVDERVTDSLDRRHETRPEPPTTGSLSISLDSHIDPTVSVTLSNDLLAATVFHERLFSPDSPLVDALQDALETYEETCSGHPALGLYDSGVTALDGLYARLATAVLRADPVSQATSAADHPLWTFLRTTRTLGGAVPFQMQSTVADIERGPIALFAMTEITPTVEIILDESFFAAKSTRRRRFLAYLHRLTPGVDVRITGSRLAVRRLLDLHSDHLPTSVTEGAHEHLRSRSSTMTEQRAQAATDALEDLCVDHPAFEVLKSIAETRREMRSYQELYADDRFDVDKSGMRRRLKRLRDAGLVETPTLGDGTYARFTPVGQVALEKHPHIDSGSVSPDSRGTHSSAVWSTERTEQTESPDGDASKAAVSDPRNNNDSTVLPQHEREGRDRTSSVDEEREPATSSPSSRSSSSLAAEYLNLADHHATAAAASSGHISLVERSLGAEAASRDHRRSRFSYDDERDEVVVSVDFSESIALTAVRLCDALLCGKARNQVLTAERVAGHPDGMGLDGLAVSHPYVLRDAVCLGWLRDVDADGHRFVERLDQARRDLLAMTGELHGDGGSIQGNIASEILRKAQGLMGVALRVYDLLGVDVVREIQFPTGVPVEEELQREVGKFLEIATSVGSRYGAYSGYRVLHEDRHRKREQLISEPEVDPREPNGTLLGSWVLSGVDVSELEPVLEECPESLELQEDEPKFSAFSLRGRIVDGNRRAAVGEAVTRILSFKPELRPDRQAISVLSGLTSDIFAAAQATMALNGELDEDQSARSLDLHDVRYGLSTLEPDAVLPEMGGDVVSSVVHALLDIQERVSTAELAELAGCSTRSLSTEANQRALAELEAAGLLEREDLGDGRATMWRLRLPFREECNSDGPVPTMLADEETTPTGTEWHLSNAVCEVLTTAADEHGVAYAISFGREAALAAFAGPPPVDRELEPLLRQYPEVEPVVSLLAVLLDQGDRLTNRDRSSSVELGMVYDMSQTKLFTAVG